MQPKLPDNKDHQIELRKLNSNTNAKANAFSDMESIRPFYLKDNIRRQKRFRDIPCERLLVIAELLD